MRLNYKIQVKNTVKYFVHGIALPLITILAIGIDFQLIENIAYKGSFQGAMISIAVVIVVVIPIVGVLNNWITGSLWFTVESTTWSIFGHGAILIVLALLNMLFLFSTYEPFPNVSTTAKYATAITILPFVNGFICKTLASRWIEDRLLRGRRRAILIKGGQ